MSRGFASEKSNLFPRSPYSASKAAADHLAMAYYHTHGLPVLITRAANNYGPYQYPEKFLPLFITHALTDQSLPLYGDGLNIREWLHVQDHCLGIERVLRKGTHRPDLQHRNGPRLDEHGGGQNASAPPA